MALLGELVVTVKAPEISCIPEASDYRVLATHIREVVLGGSIALARNITTSPEDLATLGSLVGKPFDPVALPPEKDLSTTTTIAEEGYISSATNWHHDQSFAETPPEWSMLLCISPGANAVPTVFCDASILLTFLSDAFVNMLRTLT